MSQDPFGNLREWGSVLELMDELESGGRLSECQAGLTRILRYKGNWRLREEVLKRIGAIATPTDDLIGQVSNILMDDNIYYEVRILASDALVEMLKNCQRVSTDVERRPLRVSIEKLLATPQPPFFSQALKNCLRQMA